MVAVRNVADGTSQKRTENLTRPSCRYFSGRLQHNRKDLTRVSESKGAEEFLARDYRVAIRGPLPSSEDADSVKERTGMPLKR
jgi:hypothetical protein